LTQRTEDLVKVLAPCPAQDSFPTSHSPTHIKGLRSLESQIRR